MSYCNISILAGLARLPSHCFIVVLALCCLSVEAKRHIYSCHDHTTLSFQLSVLQHIFALLGVTQRMVRVRHASDPHAALREIVRDMESSLKEHGFAGLGLVTSEHSPDVFQAQHMLLMLIWLCPARFWGSLPDSRDIVTLRLALLVSVHADKWHLNSLFFLSYSYSDVFLFFICSVLLFIAFPTTNLPPHNTRLCSF